MLFGCYTREVVWTCSSTVTRLFFVIFAQKDEFDSWSRAPEFSIGSANALSYSKTLSLFWIQMYRGQLRDGSYVTIRCLIMKRSNSHQNFMHHIELISKLRHQHLVSALGHCFQFYLDDSSVSRIFLVFEYVPNGTLRRWISGNYLTNIYPFPIVGLFKCFSNLMFSVAYLQINMLDGN